MVLLTVPIFSYFSDNSVLSDKDKYTPDNESSSGDEANNESSKESDDQFMEMQPMGTLSRRLATRLLPGSLRSKFLKSIRKNDVADVKRTLQVNLLYRSTF